MQFRTKYEAPEETNLPGIIYLPIVPIVDMEPIEACQIFDNVYFMGTKFVGVLIVKTSEGLVMIDSMENEAAVKNVVLPGMEQLGLNPSDIKYVIVTHGHFDHFGGAQYLQDTYGCKVAMSKIDAEFMPTSVMPEQFMPIGVPSVNEFVDEGSKIIVGDTTFSIYFTPGHTPGCISLTFPVYDQGKEHIMCVWGGMGMPRLLDEFQAFLKSAKYFLQVCKQDKANVEFSVHPFVDYSLEKMEAIKIRESGQAHPLVIGEDHVDLFMRCMILTIEKRIEQLKAN